MPTPPLTYLYEKSFPFKQQAGKARHADIFTSLIFLRPILMLLFLLPIRQRMPLQPHPSLHLSGQLHK